MINRRLLSFFLLFCISFPIFGQKTDSLSQKSNRYLVAKLDSFQFDRFNPLVWVYLDAYIKNAKSKNDLETIYYGYRSGIYHSKTEDLQIMYADSAIFTAVKSEKIDLVGESYIEKGLVFYNLRKYQKSLDYYLEAHKLLSNSQNEFLKNKIDYFISVIKIYLGYYEDALNLIEAPLSYFKTQNTPNGNLFYIRCLYRKGEAYLAIKNYTKAKEVNLLGLKESIKYNEKIQEQYFNLAIGIDDYYAKNYALAIQNIDKSLPMMKDNGYFEMEEKGHFYIAKSWLGLRQENKALLHFQEVDRLFAKHQYLPNELRSTYEWLINYYKKENDKDLQLYYINQLLEVDKLNAENNQYLAYKINKEYDTRRLMEEKKRLEDRFTSWKYYAVGLLILLLIITLIYFFKYRKAQKDNKLLRSQYESLINKKPTISPDSETSKLKKRVKEIPEEVVENILARLNKFEENKEFLNPNLDQKLMAEKFKTNTAYLSKVINTYKETNFNGYLNKLRINFIIDLLKKEPKYRNYTVETLSETAGFTTSRHFSDIFFSETGLRPTYFLEEIRKEKKVL